MPGPSPLFCPRQFASTQVHAARDTERTHHMNQNGILPFVAVLAMLTACASGGELESGASAPTTGTPSAQPASVAASPSPSAERSASAEPSPEATATATAATADSDPEVEIVNFAFKPEALTVSVGTEVTFTNADAYSHTATAGSGASPLPDIFDSGSLGQGETFTFVFEDPGTLAYYCAIHPNMEGTIIVEP